MSGPDERSPLLASERDGDQPTESSPLLANQPSQRNSESGEHDESPAPKSTKTKKAWRWPSIIAMVVLAGLITVVMVLGFLLPPAIQTYAEKAIVIEPTNLALDAVTPDGVRARIQGHFRIDGSRVADKNARRLGRFAAFVVRKVESTETKIHVRLPSYDNALLGTAVVPPLVVDVLDGHNTELDFLADLKTGDASLMRKIVNDWFRGKLKEVEVNGGALVQLKSGIFPLGTHDLSDSMVLEAKDVPSVPKYDIKRLVVNDIPIGDDGRKGVAANVSISAHNDYPIALTIPSIRFELSVPDCDPSESHIMLALAKSIPIEVKPKADVVADVQAIIQEIPDSLTRACPNTELSPLDHFVEQYLHGEDVKVYVRGNNSKNPALPGWAASLIDSITIPVDFPGQSFGSFLRNLSLTDVDFELPSPFADPDSPDGQPRVSGTVEVLAAIPHELNVDIAVDRLRAKGDVIYHGEKFGELNLDRWEKANSTRINGSGDHEDLLKVTSRVKNVPLTITDSDVFTDLMQKLLFGDEDLILDVKSSVDVKVATVLGNVVVKGIPAEGKIPVKQLPGDTIGALQPRVGDLQILNTSDTGVHLQALVNVTNPTPYTAVIPFISIHVLEQDHIIGEATAKNIHFRVGDNTNMAVSATWDPAFLGGKHGQEAGRQLLSDYLSGKNTTVTLRTHRGSFPTMPQVGEALSRINFTVSTPHVQLPGDGDDEESHGFIREATFHIFSSTANFILASPLQHNTVHIEHIDARAYYNHTEPIGRIVHDEPFDAPPGLSETPRLPVVWSADHVGYDKLKEAIGGSLKLDAVANVTFRIGNWIEIVHYEGKGIGAKVSL